MRLPTRELKTLHFARPSPCLGCPRAEIVERPQHCMAPRRSHPRHCKSHQRAASMVARLKTRVRAGGERQLWHRCAHRGHEIAMRLQNLGCRYLRSLAVHFDLPQGW
eukprot:scaffold136277_cov31-Tisochrysis_lutea.AAC.4